MHVKVNFKAGGSFVELPPKFSSDCESVYVAWKNQISAFSTKTGMQIAQFKGLHSPIVGFGVHHLESNECVTACSSKGDLITWKTSTHFKVINKKIDYNNIKSFHIISSEGIEINALISYQHNNRIQFDMVDLRTDTSQRCHIRFNGAFHVDVCPNNYFAVVQKNALHVTSFSNPSKTYKFCMDKSRNFTRVACHPFEEIVLTGDSTGRVLAWQNLFTRKPTQAIFHWHTLPVKCVAFSSVGSHFYSGGEESVLVRWQVDNIHEKKYLPRLPSTLSQITVSPNNSYVAISTDDNAVRIINPMFDSVSLIQNLVIGRSLDSGIIFDLRTKALVMNGNVGQIQFYSPYNNRLLYNVDVVDQNKITNERNCSIDNTQVVKMATSKGGLWMATIEMRADPEFSSELRLKFWNFDSTRQNFKLSTCVEDPHDKCINSIKFQLEDDVLELKCVSVGGDEKFKVWYLTENETVEGKSYIWRCLCVGYYHDLPCKTLSFATDGSLVCVSFGNVATTWLPDSCRLKCALTHPLHSEELDHVEFGSGKQCHLLVTASSSRLSVWNLLTLTMSWTVSLDVSLLIADAITGNMAAITKDGRCKGESTVQFLANRGWGIMQVSDTGVLVYIFGPESPDLVFASGAKVKRHHGISAAVFVPTKYSNDTHLTWYRRCPIFFIDSKMELFRLGCEEEEENGDATSYVDEVSGSMYGMTLPRTEVKKVGGDGFVWHQFQQDGAHKAIKKYLEAPIQTMIPIRFMCEGLLRSMVLNES